MISFLRGTIYEVHEDSIVLDHNGVGFLIVIPTSLSKHVKEAQTVTLHTHLMIRETDVHLYGFLDASDRRLFLSLLEVTGIGPRQAMRLLSDLPAAELRRIIIQGDSASLSRVKGIGAKTASRIILELQDKMKRLPGETQEPAGASFQRLELLMALRVLGYTDQEANTAIDALWKDESSRQKSTEEQVKLLLALLSRRPS